MSTTLTVTKQDDAPVLLPAFQYHGPQKEPKARALLHAPYHQ